MSVVLTTSLSRTDVSKHPNHVIQMSITQKVHTQIIIIIIIIIICIEEQ